MAHFGFIDHQAITGQKKLGQIEEPGMDHPPWTSGRPASIHHQKPRMIPGRRRYLRYVTLWQVIIVGRKRPRTVFFLQTVLSPLIESKFLPVPAVGISAT